MWYKPKCSVTAELVGDLNECMLCLECAQCFKKEKNNKWPLQNRIICAQCEDKLVEERTFMVWYPCCERFLRVFLACPQEYNNYCQSFHELLTL